MRFPVHVAKAKMHVGLPRSYFRSFLELGNGFGGLSHSVQSFGKQHMGSGGIRILLQNLAKLAESAGIFLRRETALRQHLMQFHVAGFRLGCRLQIFDSVGKSLSTVVAETEQSPCLCVVRISSQGCAERNDRLLKVPLLEFRETEVKLHSRQFGI